MEEQNPGRRSRDIGARRVREAQRARGLSSFSLSLSCLDNRKVPADDSRNDYADVSLPPMTAHDRARTKVSRPLSCVRQGPGAEMGKEAKESEAFSDECRSSAPLVPLVRTLGRRRGGAREQRCQTMSGRAEGRAPAPPGIQPWEMMSSRGRREGRMKGLNEMEEGTDGCEGRRGGLRG